MELAITRHGPTQLFPTPLHRAVLVSSPRALDGPQQPLAACHLIYLMRITHLLCHLRLLLLRRLPAFKAPVAPELHPPRLCRCGG